MMTMQKLEKKLQKADRKQAALYLFCNFISLMLITAYAAMMFSPTVQEILPTGGDSRKQMYMIFALALFGCVVFTVYAASLFFRKKSRQIGILMALGASRKRLAPGLFREVLTLGGVSSALGIAAGFPFVWILWNGFRVLVVDTEEMVFRMDYSCLIISAAFFVLVLGCACVLALVYLRKANIIDVVQEEHKNEPVREPGRWCGPVGIVLLFAGAVLGYNAGTIYCAVFQKYMPPAWVNIGYAPVFVGLYMVVLHTVVYGWGRRRRNPYKSIISRSMMKFQGKQTVNSLLVSTVLIAGGCFGIFYLPIISSGAFREIDVRTTDYVMSWRADQQGMTKDEISSLAGKYGVSLEEIRQCEYLSLAFDGEALHEGENNTASYEYLPCVAECKAFSESDFERLTGIETKVEPGTYLGVTNEDESSSYSTPTETTLLTNPSTGKTMQTSFAGYQKFGPMVSDIPCYILDDADFSKIAPKLAPDWKGSYVCFDVKGEDDYEFALELFHTLVKRTGPECATSRFYDRISEQNTIAAGEKYFEGYEDELRVDLSAPDASEFRSYWTYMPKIRILDKTDFLKTFAVYLMTFLFIAIVCFTAALVIGYTRCQTIALNNRYIFDDLRRLGASPDFLDREVRRQCGVVFRIPSVIGMTAMVFLYAMLLYANDGGYTPAELSGFGLCMVVIVAIAAGVYLVYATTVKKIKKHLEISG